MQQGDGKLKKTPTSYVHDVYVKEFHELKPCHTPLQVGILHICTFPKCELTLL
jgi:hypothetical protein